MLYQVRNRTSECKNLWQLLHSSPLAYRKWRTGILFSWHWEWLQLVLYCWWSGVAYKWALPSLSGTVRTEREERWEKGHIHWMHPLIADWSHILPTGYCRISEFSVKTLPEIVASALHPPQSVANTVAIFTICIAFLELSNKGTNFTTYLTVTVVTRCAAHYPVCTLFCWALDVDCALLGINVLRLYIAQGVSF